MWLFMCKCGNLYEVIRNRNQEYKVHIKCCKKCRTPRTYQKLGINNKAADHKFRIYQKRCFDKNRKFDLTPKSFLEMIQGDCYYCDDPPSKASSYKDDTFICNTLDRLNSALGYSELNCVASCPKCNEMKSNQSPIDFIKHCVLIARKTNSDKLQDMENRLKKISRKIVSPIFSKVL